MSSSRIIFLLQVPTMQVFVVSNKCPPWYSYHGGNILGGQNDDIIFVELQMKRWKLYLVWIWSCLSILPFILDLIDSSESDPNPKWKWSWPQELGRAVSWSTSSPTTPAMSPWSPRMAESPPTDCCFSSGGFYNPAKETLWLCKRRSKKEHS